jgi:predicted ArsR family transcriptional regulator
MGVSVLRDTDLHDAIDRLGVLEDPARRAAYLTVRAAAGPLSRSEVAAATGLSGRLAGFHLERLVAEGYLEAAYPTTPSGRAGHPVKRYRPSDLTLEVTVPPRRYDLAAEILAAAWRALDPHAPDTTLGHVAAAHGRRVGERAAPHRGEARFLTALRLVGYEPVAVGEAVVLRNCPFRRAAEARPDVVCAMNQAFVRGVLAGTRTSGRAAVLDRAAGRCCVVVRPTALGHGTEAASDAGRDAPDALDPEHDPGGRPRLIR